MGEYDEPFLRSTVAGRLTDHQLYHDFVRIYRGVYLSRHVELTPDKRARAAALFAGPDAVLTGFSAAALHGAKWIGGHEPAEVIRSGHWRPPSGMITQQLSDRTGRVSPSWWDRGGNSGPYRIRSGTQVAAARGDRGSRCAVQCDGLEADRRVAVGRPVRRHARDSSAPRDPRRRGRWCGVAAGDPYEAGSRRCGTPPAADSDTYPEPEWTCLRAVGSGLGPVVGPRGVRRCRSLEPRAAREGHRAACPTRGARMDGSSGRCRAVVRPAGGHGRPRTGKAPSRRCSCLTTNGRFSDGPLGRHSENRPFAESGED